VARLATVTWQLIRCTFVRVNPGGPCSGFKVPGLSSCSSLPIGEMCEQVLCRPVSANVYDAELAISEAIEAGQKF
jgi:hypothetical protein